MDGSISPGIWPWTQCLPEASRGGVAKERPTIASALGKKSLETGAGVTQEAEMLVGSILCEVAAGREPHRADLTQPRQTEGIQWLQSKAPS